MRCPANTTWHDTVTGTGANATTAGEYAKENINIYNFALTAQEVETLNKIGTVALHCTALHCTAPYHPYHTMGVIRVPSTQPVATLASSFIMSSFDMACTCCVPVGWCMSYHPYHAMPCHCAIQCSKRQQHVRFLCVRVYMHTDCKSLSLYCNFKLTFVDHVLVCLCACVPVCLCAGARACVCVLKLQTVRCIPIVASGVSA